MPRSGARSPGGVQPAGAVLDEHQHVQPLEQDRLHHYEVAGDDRAGLGGQELPLGRSGPAGRGLDARSVQDLPHDGRRDHMPEPGQPALDPLVPPGRVLARHPDDQRLDRGPGRRPSWPTPAGVVPLARGQIAVPAQDRSRGDRGGPPATGGDSPAGTAPRAKDGLHPTAADRRTQCGAIRGYWLTDSETDRVIV